jgi:hypothetical protein
MSREIKGRRLREGDAHAAAEILVQFGEQGDLGHLSEYLPCEGHFFVAASIGSAWAGHSYGYELVRPEKGSMLFL